MAGFSVPAAATAPLPITQSTTFTADRYFTSFSGCAPGGTGGSGGPTAGSYAGSGGIAGTQINRMPCSISPGYVVSVVIGAPAQAGAIGAAPASSGGTTTLSVNGALIMSFLAGANGLAGTSSAFGAGVGANSTLPAVGQSVAVGPGSGRGASGPGDSGIQAAPWAGTTFVNPRETIAGSGGQGGGSIYGLGGAPGANKVPAFGAGGGGGNGAGLAQIGGASLVILHPL